jgi:serine/threonine protein kinase
MVIRHLAPGQHIDGFYLEERLNPGGMSHLWRVTQDGAVAPMVMKIPFARGGDSPIGVVSFEVEGMILPRLSGAHVPAFIQAGDLTNPYIVMELIAGHSLKEILEEAPLPPAKVAALGAKIAIALHDLHRQKVIHLDLKPSNVIMRESGEAALIDFGLSRHDELPDLLAAEIAGPIGTGSHISPEQVLGDRRDPRSDLFALGVILYSLATGKLPFGDPTSAGEWRRRLWQDPLPPRAWYANVPPWLQEVILSCLEVAPAARPATAAQLAFMLHNPECVVLTGRATRMRRDNLAKVAARWLRLRKSAFRPSHRTVSSHLARAPIIMAAIDLRPGHEALSEAVSLAVRHLITTEPGARLACINIIKVSLLHIDPTEGAQGRSMHLQRLIELKHWARELPLPSERITFHALEAVDTAAALIDFARTNSADHIVIGARASSALRRYLGSVSSRVVAEAPCTVTVVRTGA